MSITSASIDLGVLPKHGLLLLELLATDKWAPREELVSKAEARGHSAMHRHAERNLRLLRDAGLVQSRSINRVPYFQSTSLGQQMLGLHSLRPAVYADLIHFLFFTLCNDQQRSGLPVSGWSWIYQTTCRLLWELRPKVPTFPNQAAALNLRLAEAFPAFTGGVHRTGPNVVEIWLRELDPPFLHVEPDGQKTRTTEARPWCSPELLALGIDQLYRHSSTPHETPLLLDEEHLNELSVLCLCGRGTLQEVLELALSTFPFLSLHSGEWGRSLILSQPLSIPDVL